MKVCTYDNPATMARECWQDGKLLYSYKAELFALKKWTMPPELFFFGANIGDWETGQLWGDICALGLEVIEDATNRLRGAASPQKGQ